jgi:hypothetical protein
VMSYAYACAGKHRRPRRLGPHPLIGGPARPRRLVEVWDLLTGLFGRRRDTRPRDAPSHRLLRPRCAGMPDSVCWDARLAGRVRVS